MRTRPRSPADRRKHHYLPGRWTARHSDHSHPTERSVLALELTLKFTRRFVVIVIAIVAVAALAAGLALLSGGSRSPSVGTSLTKDLLPASDAKRAGFSAVVLQATASAKTGEASCPDGAQEAFENTAGHMGIELQVLSCTSDKTAGALLHSVIQGTTSASTPPRQLGTSAVERSTDGSSYVIYWRRGRVLELVSLTIDIPATGASTTTTLAVTPPITAALQTLLSNTAVEQDSLLN